MGYRHSEYMNKVLDTVPSVAIFQLAEVTHTKSITSCTTIYSIALPHQYNFTFFYFIKVFWFVSFNFFFYLLNFVLFRFFLYFFLGGGGGGWGLGVGGVMPFLITEALDEGWEKHFSEVDYKKKF